MYARLLAAVVPMLIGVGPAHAGDNEVSLGSVGRSLRTASANALTDGNLGGGQLALGRRLPIELPARLQLWAIGSFEWGSVDGSLFESMATTIETQVVTVGARARYVWGARLALTARAELGTGRNQLTLTSNEHSVSDAGWGGVVRAGVGADAFLIATKRFSLGARVDLGMVAATAVGFTPAAAKDPNMLTLTATEASIGQLDLSSRYIAFSIVSQF
jgi:hypothetical protein